ncbi:MAG: type II toxin-antitoxin system YafQ family toxin [Ruminococcus sp.]|nr:type II toxin-antitoxin system YafQ family toxin [Ruminococcus sp.]
MTKYELVTTVAFRKEYKKLVKRNYNMTLLDEVVEKLLNGETLPPKNNDHPLTGNWKGFRECHIEPDWLLVYRIYEDTLVLSLSRTGTHSDLDF